ncbi:MAG: hypothetical protein ACLQPD_34880 [Desulfomonilaceae bacterium]
MAIPSVEAWEIASSLSLLAMTRRIDPVSFQIAPRQIGQNFGQTLYVGSSPDLILGGCHGSDEKEVFVELCEIVEEAIALYRADGKPLPPPTAGRDFANKPELPEKLADIGSALPVLAQSSLHFSDSISNPTSALLGVASCKFKALRVF